MSWPSFREKLSLPKYLGTVPSSFCSRTHTFLYTINVALLATTKDVTESSKNDRAVAAMANELRQLVDTANAPIFGIDVHGNVNEWNDKTAEITGFSKEEAFNRPMVSTFIEPKLQESVQTVLDNALHGNETSNYQLEFRTKSNETRYLLVNATTRRDADSNIVGVVGVAQDGQFYSSCLLSIFFRSVLGPSSLQVLPFWRVQGCRGTNFINFLIFCIASFLSTSPTIYTPSSLVTESSKNDRAIAAMAHELRQLVDTANAPIFGIGKYCTNDPKKLFRDPDSGAWTWWHWRQSQPPENCLLGHLPLLRSIIYFAFLLFSKFLANITSPFLLLFFLPNYC